MDMGRGFKGNSYFQKVFIAVLEAGLNELAIAVPNAMLEAVPIAAREAVLSEIAIAVLTATLESNSTCSAGSSA